MARIGNLRAPHRAGGGKAMGPVPRDLTEKIPAKIRVKALQIMLAAKLYEERIVLIESEQIKFLKTNYLANVLKPYQTDRLTFLTGFTPDDNFTLSAKNIPNINVKNPQQFHIVDMLKSDIIFMTKDGLNQLEEVIESRITNLYRNKKVPREQKELPYHKYIPLHSPKSRQDPDWTNIIKPTLENPAFQKALQKEHKMELFTPSIKNYLHDLKEL